MTKREEIDPIRYIFEIGWNCKLTPCYVEWLSRILREGYWKIRPIPFVKEIVEETEKRWFGTEYECGYFEYSDGIGFKEINMKKGHHENLHQVIHCLNEYWGIPFKKIKIVEKRMFPHCEVDVVGEIIPKKYIVVELGTLSTYTKFLLIYDPLVEEFWFDGLPYYGKSNCFYSLRANSRIPDNESLGPHMFDYFAKKCSRKLEQYANCSTYSREFLELCNTVRYIGPHQDFK